MSKTESEAEITAEPDGQEFLREFYRRMAEQGMPVRPPTAGPGWTPPEPLDISADELSAMLVRIRRQGL